MPSSQMVERRSEFVGRIGVAREDITPPVGIYARSWGAAVHDVAEGIHRPMTVTALTLQERNKRGKNPPLVLIGSSHWVACINLMSALAPPVNMTICTWV